MQGRKKQSKDRVRRDTLADIDEVWIRWQRGESLKAIGRVFGKRALRFMVRSHRMVESVPGHDAALSGR